MKKKMALFVAAILLIPVLSFSNIFTFKAGLFFPKAKSDLWQYEFDNMDLTRAKFQNSYFGIAYEYFFSREISFVLGMDGYNKKKIGNLQKLCPECRHTRWRRLLLCPQV